MPVRPHHPRACPPRPDSPRSLSALSFLNDPTRLPHASLPLNSSPLYSQRLCPFGALLLIRQEPSWRVPSSPASLSGSMQARLVFTVYPRSFQAPQETSTGLSLGLSVPLDQEIEECSRDRAWHPAETP